MPQLPYRWCWLVLLILVSTAVAQTEPGAASGGESQTVVRLSLLELLAKGRWFMVPLGAASLLGLAIVIERLVALRRKAVIPPNFADGLVNALGNDRSDIAAGRAFCHEQNSPMARVMLAAFRRVNRGEEAMEAAIEDAGTAEVAKLRNNFRLLYGVAYIAPMLGLLGTVWGMIEAFQVASQQGLGQAEKLAEGIYNALVTTFAGLMIAIPVLIFYFYFQSRVESIVAQMNDVSIRVLEHLFGQHQLDHPIKTTPHGHARVPQEAASAQEK